MSQPVYSYREPKLSPWRPKAMMHHGSLIAVMVLVAVFASESQIDMRKLMDGIPRVLS